MRIGFTLARDGSFDVNGASRQLGRRWTGRDAERGRGERLKRTVPAAGGRATHIRRGKGLSPAISGTLLVYVNPEGQTVV
jgi:hypothetical protein